MSIPFLDVGATYSEIREHLDDAYLRVMRSGRFVLGDEVTAFERELGAAVEAPNVVSVGNGLDALCIALRCAGVGPGDEVLVPYQTFVATWLAVSLVGAKPVPVACDQSALIDVDAVGRACTPRTKAVIPVHLYGLMVDMRELASVARARNLAIIEDAAQAHGATCDGLYPGTLSDAAAYSFYPGKNLGAFGDGGAIVTRDPLLADRARLMRNYGSRVKYVHEIAGQNSRLDELQAAFLRAKLPRLPEWNARRQRIAGRYLERLDGTSLVLPRSPEQRTHAWHLFVVRHPKRDALREFLGAQGIETGIHYPVPPHAQPAFSSTTTPCPETEQWGREVLSLPIGPHLSIDQADQVSDAIIAWEAATR